jgi:hypothetical protein
LAGTRQGRIKHLGLLQGASNFWGMQQWAGDEANHEEEKTPNWRASRKVVALNCACAAPLPAQDSRRRTRAKLVKPSIWRKVGICLAALCFLEGYLGTCDFYVKYRIKRKCNSRPQQYLWRQGSGSFDFTNRPCFISACFCQQTFLHSAMSIPLK